MNKPHPETFAEKISSKQRTQLIEWLAEHTYEETRMLIAAHPPDGFGLEVSIATICRFYKGNFFDIDKVRKQNLEDRAADQLFHSDHTNELYREQLDSSSTLCLQERFYELLTRPVDDVDQLKKLVYVCKQIKELKIPLDPDEERQHRLLKELAAQSAKAISRQARAAQELKSSPPQNS
jgi:hypothetical protein